MGTKSEAPTLPKGVLPRGAVCPAPVLLPAEAQRRRLELRESPVLAAQPVQVHEARHAVLPLAGDLVRRLKLREDRYS